MATAVVLNSWKEPRAGGPDPLEVRQVQITLAAGDSPYAASGFALSGFASISNLNTVLAAKHVGNSGGYEGQVRTIAGVLRLLLFQTGASAGHTHTGPSHSHVVPVTAGVAGDPVFNNLGVLESVGGQDLTTAAAGTGATGSASDVAAALAEPVGAAVIGLVLELELKGT